MNRFPSDAHIRGGRAAAVTNIAGAERFYAPLLAPVAAMRRQGLSLREIAAELTRLQMATRHGIGARNPVQVGRILARAERAGLTIASELLPIQAAATQTARGLC